MKRLLPVLAGCAVLIIGGYANSGVAEEAFKITPDVVYGHKAGMALTFDVIRPKEQNGAAVLFMMSGGWVSFSAPPEGLINPKAGAAFMPFRELAEHGFTVFIVRHGSSPQFKVPEAVADVRRAVRFVRLHAKDFGIDADRIGICGGSAGGHLSLMLGVASDNGERNAKDNVDRTSDRVAAVVAYFPPVDLREWVGQWTDTFPALNFEEKLARGVSPVLFVTPDDPPTLLIHGDSDTLVRIDNSQRILAVFKKKKVPCDLIVMKGAGHGFGSEQGKQASKALVAWFDKYLAKGETEHKSKQENVAAGS